RSNFIPCEYSRPLSVLSANPPPPIPANKSPCLYEFKYNHFSTTLDNPFLASSLELMQSIKCVVVGDGYDPLFECFFRPAGRKEKRPRICRGHSSFFLLILLLLWTRLMFQCCRENMSSHQLY